MFPSSSSGFVPGYLMQALLQVLRSEGIVLEAFTERAPALGDPADFAVSDERFRELLQALTKVECAEPLGLLIGARITESNLHAPGVLVTVSRTMAEAYASCMNLTDHAESAPAGLLALHGDKAVWTLQPSALGELWEDLMLSLVFNLAHRFLLGTQSSPSGFADAISVQVARPRPANAAAYESCFRGRVSFDAPATQLTFARALLDLPRPGVDGALATDMRELLLRRVAPPASAERWSDRVQAALRQRAKLADVDFTRLAQRWGLSLRTLRRRIAREGHVLSELLDAVRFERARHLLQTTQATQAEIAEALGYADETGFRRAFKRWSGSPPSALRELAQPRGRVG